MSSPEFLFETKMVIMSNLSVVILNWLCQFHFFNVYMYSCPWHVCLIYSEARREYQILWNGSYRELWDVKWMLKIKPGSFERIGSSCKCWAISTDPVCQYQIYKFCIYVHHEKRSVVLILFVWSLYLVWDSRLQKKNLENLLCFSISRNYVSCNGVNFFLAFCRIQQFFRIWSFY